MKKTRITAAVLSLAMAFSLSGCLTKTTTSDVYYDETSTYVVSGQSGSSTTTGSSSKKNNTSDKKNNSSTKSDLSTSHTTTKKGDATLDFTPAADAGAKYDVKGTVTIAVDTARPTDYDAMFDVMQKLYPNVKIKFDYWTHNESDSAVEYLSTRAATGKMADIIWDDAGCIPSYVMQGWVYPITKFVNADPEKANIPTNLINDYTFGGELYALPHQAHFDVEIFNMDLINKLGLQAPGMTWTMDDYQNYLSKAADKFSSKLCVGTGSLGQAYTRYGWWLAMQKGANYGQWGYNYNTKQVDSDILVGGAKKMREWRSMKAGVEAWYEQTQKASNGVTQLESNLGITDWNAAWTSGKALIMDSNTGNTNKTNLNYKFNYKVVPTPNTNGRLSMHVDCSFITSACKDENIEAAYQLLRFMTFSTNGNLARLTMYDDSQKGKYALNSKLYYPTSKSATVINKFNSLSAATETDKYMVANISNSSRFDVQKLVPNIYDTFFKDAASALNNVTDGKDDGSGLKEAIGKWNADISKTISEMNSEIKKVQDDFNKKH